MNEDRAALGVRHIGGRLEDLAADRPLLLYMCSSAFVAPDEIAFVRRFIDAVRGAADPAIRNANVLVRPHPAHLKQWERVDLREWPNVARWSGLQTMNADQGLYDSLLHADAVIGLNTSAMIEAGILGKSVHGLVVGEFAGGQEQTIHFAYLRAANGGLLHEATTLEEHTGQLAATIRGDLPRDGREQRFIERFVRPRGIDVPVTPIFVSEIEGMADMVKAPAAREPLWHRPLRWGVRQYVGPLVQTPDH
jgi:hypothetical protein